MGNVVVWHGKDGDLSDGTITAFNTSGTLIDSGLKIEVRKSLNLKKVKKKFILLTKSVYM